MASDGRIIATIHPAKSDAEKPMFEIIPSNQMWRQPSADVRPCDHERFTLDEKWRTVTCGECKTEVDAFAALLYYARNYKAVESHRESMQMAERSLHGQELRRLKGLKFVTAEEVAEIKELIHWEHSRSVEQLSEAASRIGRAIQVRKWDATQERRNRVTRKLPTTTQEEAKP